MYETSEPLTIVTAGMLAGFDGWFLYFLLVMATENRQDVWLAVAIIVFTSALAMKYYEYHFRREQSPIPLSK